MGSSNPPQADPSGSAPDQATPVRFLTPAMTTDHLLPGQRQARLWRAGGLPDGVRPRRIELRKRFDSGDIRRTKFRLTARKLGGQQSRQIRMWTRDHVGQYQLAPQSLHGLFASGDRGLDRRDIPFDHDRDVGRADFLFADQLHGR